MDTIELLRAKAEEAFGQLLTAIDGVDQPLSWAVIPMREGEYLHSNGSILTIVQHVAGSKLMYASSGFLNGQIRFREIADFYEAIGSDWAASVEELKRSHEVWMQSWAGITADDLEQLRPYHSGREIPIWRFLTVMEQHDAYHAGQIEVLKVSLTGTDVEPPSTAEDMRQYCSELPLW